MDINNLKNIIIETNISVHIFFPLKYLSLISKMNLELANIVSCMFLFHLRKQYLINVFMYINS